MITKRVLNGERIRQIPHSFTWIDRRFVRDGYIMACSRDEILLYLFLTLVGDKFGIGFYGDEAIRRLIHISQEELVRARDGLIEKGFIEYKRPLYQVLELPQYRL